MPKGQIDPDPLHDSNRIYSELEALRDELEEKALRFNDKGASFACANYLHEAQGVEHAMRFIERLSIYRRGNA